MRSSFFKEKRIAVVFAHPDDEVIFASSLLESSSKIILCYSELKSSKLISDGRNQVKTLYPLSQAIFLDLSEPERLSPLDEFNDWRYPVENEFGIKSSIEGSRFSKSRKAFNELFSILREQLNDIDLVITHNPWGEYGHPQHVMIHRAVTRIAKTKDIRILVPGVFSLKSKYLMNKTVHRLGTKPIILDVNKSLSKNLQAIYIDNNCWTWNDKNLPSRNIFYKLNDYDLTNSNIDSQKNYFYEHFFQFIDKPYRIHSTKEYLSMTKFRFFLEFLTKIKNILFRL